jgi:hypothetical protein
LDPQKAKTHIPNLPKTDRRFGLLHGDSPLLFLCLEHSRSVSDRLAAKASKTALAVNVADRKKGEKILPRTCQSRNSSAITCRTLKNCDAEYP